MPEYYCYLLKSVESNKTYIGSTYEPIRRLNEHNGLHKKGAKYTSGELWEMIAYVTGFETFNQCLSFEYSWKRCRTKKCKTTVERRWMTLQKLFSLGNTNKKWFTPPFTVHILNRKWYPTIMKAWNNISPENVTIKNCY